MSHGQNVPRTKRPKGQNVPRAKRPKVQNFPRVKMTYSNYQVFNIKIVLENWQHTRMLGNGPQPCTKFVIGVFLFWGG